MYNVALCDDNVNTLRLLEEAIIQYSNEHDIQVQIQRYSHFNDFYLYYDQFDVYFLELDLLEFNGQDLVQMIRNKNKHAEIVIMNSDDFYLSFSFLMNVAYYLCKPIEKAQLNTALQIVFSRIVSKECIIKSKKGQRRILLDDLLYIDIQQRSSCFHLKNETIYSPCLHGTFRKENGYLLNHQELLLVEPSLIFNLDNIKELTREYVKFVDDNIFYLPRKGYDKIYPVWSYYHQSKEREEIF